VHTRARARARLRDRRPRAALRDANEARRDREREGEGESCALAKETGNVLAVLSTSSIAPLSFAQLGKRLAKPLGEWDSRAIMQQSDADNSRLGASGRLSVSFSPDPPDRVPADETRSESNEEFAVRRQAYYASPRCPH